MNTRRTIYWSASTNAGSPTEAWGVGFLNGNVVTASQVPQHLSRLVCPWCHECGGVLKLQ